MSLSLRFAAGSHKGMIREGNEDSGYAGPRLLAIADGMGGQAAGEVASSEVISTLVGLDDDVPGSDILTSLGSAVQQANDQLRVMVEEDPQLEGMGTTLTALLWTGRRLGLVHVGDSRAYLLRDGRLTQITQDHTWVQRLVDEGRITEEEATTHPQRSLLMRALGSGDHVDPDLSVREVRAGDRYLICSDGLSGVVSHQTLEETLAGYQGPHETVQELIQLALRGGGPDNITCIVADVLDVDGNETLDGQLNDTPVVVGAVAENQSQLGDAGAMHTPAGRAAGLGRGVPHQAATPPAGGFGPPGSGDASHEDGAYELYSDDELTKPRRGRWLKRSLILVLGLGAVGAALYGGYRWTQTQYYVGAKEGHVALYQGVSQDFAWFSLGKVREERRDVELKYLPAYQRNQVKETIAVGSLDQARDKLQELGKQASACEKRAVLAKQAEERRKAEERKKAEEKEKAAAERTSASGSAPVTRTVSAGAQSTSTPKPGPSLSEDEQLLAKQCDSTQQ
ncbi:PP2C family protein-serine/threonine phosphatase [Streptomyces meridianus]|uniref:Protein phosphatase 2C domain-containing protein n=1 Tax=Streptomyces meridianus TaxID=2938945 RepID=A0ABT0X7Z9_9ACTN|nr:PP2C family serine/threonine-protein phosphatase [Streptomyces meridianus]MCM2578450.1 protein phosphatase 2C domain-containing protein [Streptomyces meridianus]